MRKILSIFIYLLGCSSLANAIELSKNTNLTGFADGQFNWVEKGHSTVTQGSNSALQSGFLLNDGAIYLSHQSGAANFFLDLPFYMNQDPASSILFRAEKAQAYIDYAYPGKNLSWRLGQFDGLYGYEANDSKDVFFVGQGLVYNEVPLAHTGILTTYTGVREFTFNLLVANQHNQQVEGQGDLDIGAKAAWEHNNYNVSLGVLRSDPRLNSQGQSFLADLTGEAKVARWTLAAELVSKWIRTPDEHSAAAIYLSGIYSINSMWSAGVRLENESNLSKYAETRASLGANAKMSKELTAKFTLTEDSAKDLSASTTVGTMITSVAAVYSF